MNDIEDSNTEKLKNLKNQIFKVSDILRGHFRLDQTALLILPQIFTFRFYQLSKEKRLPNKFLHLNVDEMPLDSFQDLCDVMNVLNSSKFRELNDCLTPFLNEYETIIGEEVIEAVFNKLKKNDYSSEFLGNQTFGEFFSGLITHLFKNSHVRGENLSTEVTQNILSSLKLTPGKYKVLDPAFGVGNSIVKFCHNQRKGVELNIFGYEINTLTRSYGVLNLICNGIYSFYLKNCDAFKEEWIKNNDIIISDPPLGNHPIYQSVPTALINKALDHLATNGRAVFLVSNKELHGAGSVEKSRKSWIFHNYLKSVISINASIGREETNIPVNFLFFDKGNNDDIVNFIDLGLDEELSKERLIELSKKPIFSQKFDEEYQILVSREEIRRNDYNLMPNRYVGFVNKKIKNLEKEGRGIPLKEVLTTISAQKATKSEVLKFKDKYLKISDLLDDPFDYTIDSSELETTYDDIDNNRVRVINTSCLLIAKSGKKIKPTYVKTGSPFLLDKAIYALSVDAEKIRTDYLIYQLHTDFFLEQIKMVQRGVTIPYLSLKDFLELIIEVPEDYDKSWGQMQQQYFLEDKEEEALRELHRQNARKTEELKRKLSILEKAEKIHRDVQEEELIDFVNHNVRNKLSVVKDSIEVLYDYMSNNEGKKIDLNALEGKPLEGEDESDLSTIGDLFNYSITGLNRALQALKNLEDFRVDQFDQQDLQIVNIYDLIKKYIESIQHSKEYSISVSTKEENKHILKIKIAKSPFENVLDNLLENAEKHGFKGGGLKFSVLFDISIDEDFVVIDYKNDGEPMIDYDPERFVSRGGAAGRNAGKGFGGFFINRTIEKLDGRLEIIKPKKESQWNVHFRIKLPIEKEV